MSSRRQRSNSPTLRRSLPEHGDTEGLDASRLAIAGDSVGGNMTAAIAILAKQRGDVRFVHQSLYYPVTDAAQDTDSYRGSPMDRFSRPKGWRGSGTRICRTTTSAPKSPRPRSGQALKTSRD